MWTSTLSTHSSAVELGSSLTENCYSNSGLLRKRSKVASNECKQPRSALSSYQFNSVGDN